jgi:hypothetical protein
METALRLASVDPAGSSEAVRVTFEKILDPLSVVREAEFERQGAGLSLIDRLQGTLQKYVDGGGNIPLPVLQGMVETARQFVQISGKQNEADRQRIIAQARAWNLDPDIIVPGASNLGGGAPPPGVGAAPAPASPAATGAPPAGVTPGPDTGNLPKGTFVGNEYTGQTGTRQSDGAKVGRDAQGNVVELVEHGGKFYIK